MCGYDETEDNIMTNSQRNHLEFNSIPDVELMNGNGSDENEFSNPNVTNSGVGYMGEDGEKFSTISRNSYMNANYK